MAPTYNVNTLRQLAAAGSEFYRGILADFNRYGALTTLQAQTLAERELRDEAPVVNVDGIEHAFANAKAAGVTRPKIRLAGFAFTLAPMTGKNPGAVYVVDENDNYLGKVLSNKFFASGRCGLVDAKRVTETLKDPKQAAIAYGKKFGRCSICARTLSDPESVARGIGPICASKFGW